LNTLKSALSIMGLAIKGDTHTIHNE